MSDPRSVLLDIIENVERVILGKTGEVGLAVIALAADGHLLIEGGPGSGKGTLARALAVSAGCTFSRFQFTSQPRPLLGSQEPPQLDESDEARLTDKLVSSQVFHADKVNLASARLFALLSEGMEERQVAVEAVAWPVPSPFMVIATQNLKEPGGVFSRLDSHIDQFLMRVQFDYPDALDELALLESQHDQRPIEQLEAVATPEEVEHAQRNVREIWVAPDLREYMVNLVAATRSHSAVEQGVSPRGTAALLRCTQALALLSGRDHVLPDDVLKLAHSVFEHRIVIEAVSDFRRQDARTVIDDVLERVPVPGARAAS